MNADFVFIRVICVYQRPIPLGIYLNPMYA